MSQIVKFYIVDVFANNKYEGNQLAVFIDLENAISDNLMQKIAKEINFAETTFVKSNTNDERFVVRIFTPEHEIPFAGPPIAWNKLCDSQVFSVAKNYTPYFGAKTR